MNKNKLLIKVNWTKDDISEYFGLTKRQVNYKLKKANIQPLKISRSNYSIDLVLRSFGTSLEREMANNYRRNEPCNTH